MSAYGTLEFSLGEILLAIKPSEDDRNTRVRIIDEFRAVVESVKSLKGATVEPFGSFLSNLYTRWGDLDISIELPNGSYVSSVEKNYKVNILRDVLQALTRKGGVSNVQFNHFARVPIIIFESNNISCDVSIDNLSSQMGSKFLLWISRIDERFRDMVLLVKEWAKALNINESKSGTLSSYSICLLVVFHFQTCRPAILPPLKEISGNIADNLTGARDTVERYIERTCAANITRFKSNRFRPANQSSLSELFIAFFEKFSIIGSKASEQAICTHTGQWEIIKSMRGMLKTTCPLYIQDPFVLTENAAKAVGTSQFVRIAEAFEKTYQRLLLASHDSLIASLVRPEVRTQVVRRISQLPPGAYLGSHPQGDYETRGGAPFSGATMKAGRIDLLWVLQSMALPLGQAAPSYLQYLQLKTRPSCS